MIDFINEHRAIHGVEPICRVLPIAPSTYHAHAARRADPGKLPARAHRDAAVKIQIGRVLRRELPRLWRPQGLATARPGRDRGRPLHRGAPDADDGSAGVARGKTIREPIGRGPSASGVRTGCSRNVRLARERLVCSRCGSR